MIKIKSAAKVAEEEELLRQAQIVCAKQPRTSDTTDYEAAKTSFREQCMTIRQFLAVKYPQFVEDHPVLKTFRGAFGEETQLVMSLALETMDMQLIGLLLVLREIDNAMEYEAEKLCILTPGSWKAVWADELEPEEQSENPVAG